MKDNKTATNRQELNNHNNESSYVSFNLISETAKLKIKNILKTILVIFNIACLLTSFIFISIYKFELRNFEFISTIFLICTYLITLYFIAIIKKDQSKFIKNEPQQSTTTNDHNKPNLIKSHIILTTVMIIIGFNDSLYNLTQFFNNLFLILNNQFNFNQCGYTSLIMLVIESLLKVFYQLFILLFVLQYENYYVAISRKRLYLKLFIIYLLISFIIQWIYIILQQIFEDTSKCLYTSNNMTLTTIFTRTITPHDQNGVTTSVTSTSIPLTTTNTLTSFKTYEPILYPIAVEFRIFCFIEILNLYFSVEKINKRKAIKEDSSTIMDQETDSDDDLTIVSNIKSDTNEINNNDFYSIPIIFGVFLMSCTIGFIFFQNDNLDNTNNNFILIINEFFELIILFFGIILLFVILRQILKIAEPRISFHSSILLILWPIHRFRFKKGVGFCKQFFSKWRKNDLATSETKIDLFALNVSCFSLIIYSALSIKSLIDFINNNNNSTSSDGIKQTAKILSLISLIVLLIQIIFQSLIIGFMMYNQNHSRVHFKKLIQFLILLNFVLWLTDTFSAKKYFINSTNSSINWSIAGPLLIPFSLLYRIQTCFILIKIFFDKYGLSTLPIQYKISLYTPMAVFGSFD